VCMYIHIHIYIYTHVCTCIHIYMHLCTHTYTNTHLCMANAHERLAHHNINRHMRRSFLQIAQQFFTLHRPCKYATSFIIMSTSQICKIFSDYVAKVIHGHSLRLLAYYLSRILSARGQNTKTKI